MQFGAQRCLPCCFCVFLFEQNNLVVYYLSDLCGCGCSGACPMVGLGGVGCGRAWRAGSHVEWGSMECTWALASACEPCKHSCRRSKSMDPNGGVCCVGGVV